MRNYRFTSPALAFRVCLAPREPTFWPLPDSLEVRAGSKFSPAGGNPRAPQCNSGPNRTGTRRLSLMSVSLKPVTHVFRGQSWRFRQGRAPGGPGMAANGPSRNIAPRGLPEALRASSRLLEEARDFGVRRCEILVISFTAVKKSTKVMTFAIFGRRCTADKPRLN